jgi:hypothetical protein
MSIAVRIEVQSQEVEARVRALMAGLTNRVLRSPGVRAEFRSRLVQLLQAWCNASAGPRKSCS